MDAAWGIGGWSTYRRRRRSRRATASEYRGSSACPRKATTLFCSAGWWRATIARVGSIAPQLICLVGSTLGGMKTKSPGSLTSDDARLDAPIQSPDNMDTCTASVIEHRTARSRAATATGRSSGVTASGWLGSESAAWRTSTLRASPSPASTAGHCVYARPLAGGAGSACGGRPAAPSRIASNLPDHAVRLDMYAGGQWSHTRRQAPLPRSRLTGRNAVTEVRAPWTGPSDCAKRKRQRGTNGPRNRCSTRASAGGRRRGPAYARFLPAILREFSHRWRAGCANWRGPRWPP